MNPAELEATAKNIAYSAQIALGPASTPQARLEAHTYCNNFLETASPADICSVGFTLSSHPDPTVIISALQFIEHVTKFKWQALQEGQREAFKERLLFLVKNGLESSPSSTTSCPMYLQEALAKVIVEIAKREWPQLWPNMFPQLFEMANSSDLALLVLRRMVEDVATLQTVDCPERRRELSQSLTAIAPEVISTFFRVLIDSVTTFKRTGQEECKRRAKISLGCLLPYIEWNNPMIFVRDNRIPTLFALLPEPWFQMEAADCLVQLVERKALKKEDRHEIPKISLELDSFGFFLQAVGSVDSKNEDLLRKLGEILCHIADNVGIGKVNVENLVLGFEKLAARKEAISVLGATTAVNRFIKSIERETSKDGIPGLDKRFIGILSIILNKFVSAPPLPVEREEMARLKSEFSTFLRSVGRRVPNMYQEVNSWLQNSLSSPTALQNFQWEALVLVVDSVSSSVSHEDGEMVKMGLSDLESCLSKFNVERSLELKSLILSTISALFVFLSLAKKRGEFAENHLRLMLSIFDSVFKCFSLEESPSAREIRRHSCSLMVKLSTKFPDVLVAAFDFIHSSASSIGPRLTTMEYTSIIEALMVISNAWNDPARQSNFIRCLLNPAEWQELSAIADSYQTFTAIFPDPLFFEKKPILIRNLSILYAALRRIKKGSKPMTSVLQQNQNSQNSEPSFGNASVGSGELEGTHPSYDHVCPLLPIVLKLVKTLHSLLETPQTQFLMGMNDVEKACILGVFNGTSVDSAAVPVLEVEKTHSDKLQVFVQTVLELAYGILGSAACILAPKFYLIPQVGEAYLTFVGYNSHLLDDFRLRGVIRAVFKPFLSSCPIPQAPLVIKPFAQKFFPFCLNRLIGRWTAIENSKNTSAEGEEEKEVLENSALRLLTKEYVELLWRLLERQSVPIPSAKSGESNEVEMDNDIETSAGGGNTQTTPSEVGEIGLMLLSDPICFTSIVNCVVSCMVWEDSVVCLKAARCILMTWNSISKEMEVVRGTLAMTLRAVCLWVENEANMDSLLKVLDACFRNYDKDPMLLEMLKQWGAPENEVQKLVGLCNGSKNEKKRKDLFRKLVNNNPSLEKNKSPKSQWLRGLPQLKLSNDAKVARQNSPEIDLHECFSHIHK